MNFHPINRAERVECRTEGSNFMQELSFNVDSR